jgi:hypothetical protein
MVARLPVACVVPKSVCKSLTATLYFEREMCDSILQAWQLAWQAFHPTAVRTPDTRAPVFNSCLECKQAGEHSLCPPMASDLLQQQHVRQTDFKLGWIPHHATHMHTTSKVLNTCESRSKHIIRTNIQTNIPIYTYDIAAHQLHLQHPSNSDPTREKKLRVLRANSTPK